MTIWYRRSRPEEFCWNGVLCRLTKFTKFKRKHLHQSLVFKVVCLQPATLSKTRLQHRCSLVNFTIFSASNFIKNKAPTKAFSCEFCKFFLSAILLKTRMPHWCFLMDSPKMFLACNLIKNENPVQVFSGKFCKFFPSVILLKKRLRHKCF